MKTEIETLIKNTLKTLQQQNQFPENFSDKVFVEHTRDNQHGDFATNIAMLLAKELKRKPREIAEIIANAIPKSSFVNKVEIAGPGFINLFLSENAWYHPIQEILKQKDSYGKSTIGKGKKIHLEFVSANPTGPLHVGHGRGAAYGAAVGNLLENAGFHVHREYYVNDGGRQMDILATSVWLRYCELLGEKFDFPSNAYRGDYIVDIAKKLQQEHAKKFLHSKDAIFKDLPLDEPQGGDKEIYIDALIQRAKNLLGPENYRIIFDKTLEEILSDIKNDLAEFGIKYDEFFSERSLIESGAVEKAIAKMKAGGHLYEKDGALWFRSTDFGDDKDRVMLRENGQPTYFGVDMAYRQHNLETRGFNQLINILGSDHHGYTQRIAAGIEALGFVPAPVTFLLVQFATLYRGSERVQMSTRSGSFVTLRELREEAGNEATRFFYILRKCEQHMDFDLELAKSKSNENPLYYLQYAHARICSVMRQLKEKNLSWDETQAMQSLNLLTESHEKDLMKLLSRYNEITEAAALNYEPHFLAHYLRDVANAFHTYYNAHPFLVDEANLRHARLGLIMATRQVLQNGLKLLSVSAPEVM